VDDKVGCHTETILAEISALDDYSAEGKIAKAARPAKDRDAL